MGQNYLFAVFLLFLPPSHAPPGVHRASLKTSWIDQVQVKLFYIMS